LNSHFRNIKENANLDALEESDDEEEFEDMRLDKFVDTEKEVPFECKYDTKFKAWVPIKPVNDTQPNYTKYKTVQYL
jgi:hypothetical protein